MIFRSSKMSHSKYKHEMYPLILIKKRNDHGENSHYSIMLFDGFWIIRMWSV